jgi:hypothetical protein
MDNIPQSKINQLTQDTVFLTEQLNHAISWVDSYLKAEERSSTILALKKIRRELSKIKFSLSQKPAAALYGESQVGKSYLIKNLLSSAGQQLEISDPGSGDTYDFLEKINPRGDQTEATSLVTRFTVDCHYINEQYPVAIRLLNPKDIALLLIDSYFNDIKEHQTHYKEDALRAKAEQLLSEYTPRQYVQMYLTEDDIFDIQEYLEKYFLKDSRIFSDSGFWLTVSSFIQKVPPEEWYRIFEVVWGGLGAFNEIFKKLIVQLETLHFVTYVYAEFSAVLRETGTILHVARLGELVNEPLYEDSSREKFQSNVRVLFVNPASSVNVESTIRKSDLCALSGELILQVNPALADSKEFLKNSDLLDFPGARSRLENKESLFREDRDGRGRSEIDKMVLRGKVAYIFNKYSRERLINNLLFCNKDSKIEVTYIPKLINEWIETYVGETAEERQKVADAAFIPPLFVIFTFFNNDLEFDSVNNHPDNLHEKWTKRFITIFQNEIVTSNFNWHREWTSKGMNFQNLYLLRDFIHSKGSFRSDKGVETGYADSNFNDRFTDTNDYFTKLKDSFLKHEFVRNHFSDPENSWNAAATPGNDGSELIIDKLTTVSGNSLRTSRFVQLLNAHLRKISEILSVHYHSDQIDDEIKKAAKIGAEIHADLNLVFSKDPFNFGRFVRMLSINEKFIYNFYHDKLRSADLVKGADINQYIYFRESSPDISNKKSYEENLEILRASYHHSSREEVEKFFSERKIDLNELFYGELNALKNSSTILAEKLRDEWFDNYLNPGRFQSFVEDGLSQGSLTNLLDTIKKSYDLRNISALIAGKIKRYVDRYDRIHQAEEMIADISACVINDFVTSMGWSFYSSNELEKIVKASEANHLYIQLPDSENRYHPVENDELQKLFQNVDQLNENLSKTPPDEEAIKNVPVIRQYRRWRDLVKVSLIANCHIPTYDVEANRNLKVLIDKVGSLKFSVNN